jgi:hypothetical protein
MDSDALELILADLTPDTASLERVANAVLEKFGSDEEIAKSLFARTLHVKV